MKTEYIKSFVKATHNAFLELIKVEIKPGSPQIYQGQKDLFDFAAIIGFAGDTQGEVILSFPYECGLKISSAFTGVKSSQIDDNVIDAIGEMVNVVAGNSKEGFQDIQVFISLPQVICGSQINLKLPKNVPCITIPFDSELGSFNLIVSLKEY